MGAAAGKPSWDSLFELAAAQQGYFSTRQAASAGFSNQLLLKHLRAGRVVRRRRGIYRLVHFPAGEHEDLVIAWLWSDRAGVVSHETALAIRGLSDVLPDVVHLTLPHAWAGRRLRVPRGIEVHFADLATEDREWVGPVPATVPRRALIDCAKSALAPNLLRQAAEGALRRGLVDRRGISEVAEALAPYGGLPS